MMKLFGRKYSSERLKIIIIGAGEVGFNIAQRLSMEDKEVLVIDKDATAIKRLLESVDVQALRGSGSSPRVLDEAGIQDADILLAVTDSDEINIIACFFANVLAPKALKLARIRNEEYTLYRDALSEENLNIGIVINPEVEVVRSIDRLVALPGVVDYSEFADGKVNMVAVRVTDSEFNGVQLMELRQRIPGVEFVIGAIVREDKLIIPRGQDTIHDDDLLYLVCKGKDLREIQAAFGAGHQIVRNVLIIGGGNIGYRLAQMMERRGLHTKLVELDEDRCGFLAEKLDKTIVLKGDGTDQDLLKEENVDKMDVVISLTGDEETNILTSLLAKNLGAGKTVTRIDKSAYLPLVHAIGIEHSVSPRLSAVNSILHHVRRGSVISSVAIKGEQAEALEAVAETQSPIVDKPIMSIPFPKGAVILAIMRGDEVFIPSGASVIKPGDRVIIFATRQAVSKVEKALTMKLEYF